MKCKSVILSPHSDDAALSLGGLLLSGRLGITELLTVFSVSNCTFNDLDDTVENITRTRKMEDREFSGLCNPELRLSYMDMPDAPLRLGIDSAAVFDRSMLPEDRKISRDIAGFVAEKYCFDISVYAPLALGGHIDHWIVLEAACLLADEGYRVFFYEDLPYASACSGNHIEERIEFLKKKTGRKFSSRISCPGVSIGEKIDALKAYRSQLDSSMAERVMRYHKKLNNHAVNYKILE
ncbi:MAG: hypothetical protein MI784_07130 [Cytophagales bacterium]|nr:hypothetical protein [Cytophagales bacterium]